MRGMKLLSYKFSVVLCLGLIQGQAFADVAPQRSSIEPTSNRRLDVALNLAINAPHGFLGLEVDRHVGDGWLSLAGGVGLNPDGAEVYLVPRLRLHYGRFVLGTGLGLAYGSYREDPLGISGGTEIDGAVTAFGEVFVEHRWERFFARLSAGGGVFIHEGRCRVTDPDDAKECGPDHGKARPFGGLAFGYSF